MLANHPIPTKDCSFRLPDALAGLTDMQQNGWFRTTWKALWLVRDGIGRNPNHERGSSAGPYQSNPACSIVSFISGHSR